jgi:splicing factor U2AF subunit
MAAGAAYLASIIGTEKDRVNCPFYFKVGACRHGDRCERRHLKPALSQTVLLGGMYQPILTMDQDPQKHFEDFYEDVFSECMKFGEVEELVVCENLNDHLRGNVYIKFYDEDAAAAALKGLSGRFYAGKLIIGEFSPVTDFRDACCRQHEEAACARGGYCNFLHPKPPNRNLLRQLYAEQRKMYRHKKRRSHSRSRSGSRSKSRSRSRDRDHRHNDDSKRKRGEDRDKHRRSRSPRDRDSDRRDDRGRRDDRDRRDRDSHRDRDRDRDRGRERERERDDRRGGERSRHDAPPPSQGNELPPGVGEVLASLNTNPANTINYPSAADDPNAQYYQEREGEGQGYYQQPPPSYYQDRQGNKDA